MPGGDTEGGDDPPEHQDECDAAAETEGGLGTDCSTYEEGLPPTLVGDDNELGGAAAAKVIKVRVYHESKATRASHDCNNADSRIYSEETVSGLECDFISVTSTRHDQGTDNGYDDWQDFLDDYYTGNHNYKTSTEAYNGGRFVVFLPDENRFDRGTGNIAGYGVGCGDPTWSSTSRSQTCGHAALYNKAGDYFVHSASYREGQTFAHEIIHLLGISSSGHTNHDDGTVRQNYNGDEGCNGWGNDFTSRNVFYYTSKGSSCAHRHYWLTTIIEGEVDTNAAIHQTQY